MMSRAKHIIALLIILGASSIAMSQQAFSSCGADITGDGGAVCFTVGQLQYAEDSGSGSLTHGVQQIFRQCAGDLNSDGIVNIMDLLDLLVQYPCSMLCTTDLTGDGILDTVDLLYFLSIFGSSCNF